MKNVFVVTDPGLDPDDIVCAWMLANAHKLGIINLVGAIANFSPALKRARLLKGVFNALECDIPVAKGTDCGCKHKSKSYEFDFPLASNKEIAKTALLLKRLDEAEDRSISLLLISGLTDIAVVIHYFPELLTKKLKEVYIMGGASWSAEGEMIVDPTASNNKFDTSIDAQSVYNFFVSNSIPLRVLTRYAAYSVPITTKFYEDLAGINIVGAHLNKIQRQVVRGFWEFANKNPVEHRQNRSWFCQTFCEVEDIPLKAKDDPWPYVRKTALYDPLTALWMIHPEFFSPSSMEINGVSHQIVGVSPSNSGIPDQKTVLNVIKGLLREQCLGS